MAPPKKIAKIVFVDTAAWVALLNKSDMRHQEALNIHQCLLEADTQLVTTELIFAEMGGSFSKAAFHSISAELRSAFMATPNYLAVAPTQELFEEGWSFFKKYNDKNWSLVDCISFLIMKKLRLRQAFTFDHHFEQAGFDILSIQ